MQEKEKQAKYADSFYFADPSNQQLMLNDIKKPYELYNIKVKVPSPKYMK